MTARTRRIVIICFVTLAVLAPVETILLRAISTPSETQAVEDWVGGLSDDELAEAADLIQEYPFAYRKAIMKRSTPAARSSVWRGHLQGFLDANPSLEPNAVIAITAAMAILSPEVFASPTQTDRLQLRIVAEQLTDLLGREEAEYLLYRLGPVDGTFASREPLVERFASLVRQLVVASAEDDCECSMSFGCDGIFTHCSDEIACTPDEEWPACGWGWFEDCDGLCRVGTVG